MINLTPVSLWAVVGVEDPLLLDRTLRVLRYCHAQAFWGDKLLFTVINPEHYRRFEGLRVLQIPAFTERKDWEIFIGKVMPKILAQYPFTLSIHDDGFPINMDMWHKDFLSYDYIGAPWPHSGLVGSGGFSLTSGRFNDAMTRLPWYDGGVNVDEWCCRVHRQRMLELDMRFPSPEVAACFCTEATDNDQRSFGYHGRLHAVEKHRMAWEQIEAFEKEAGWKD